MGIKTHKFARKPFYVDAVRVSLENLEEVAKWCEGKIRIDEEEGSETFGQQYIEVKVFKPMKERQKMAFVGDWVLASGNGFKVYTPKAFDKSFEKVKYLTKEQADAAGIRPPIEPRQRPKNAPKKQQRRRPKPSDLKKLQDKVGQRRTGGPVKQQA